MSRRGRRRAPLAAVLFLIVYGLFYLGFLLHRSPDPWLLGYSRPMVVILLALAIPWLLVLLRAARGASRGPKAEDADPIFAPVPTLVTVVVVYLLASSVFYYRTRLVAFHPFLQNHPAVMPAPAGADPAFRILALGGSTTGGSDPTYAEALRTMLAARCGDRVALLNAGRPWFTSQDSLIYYTVYGVELRADLVLVMHAINDLYRSFESPQWTIGAYDARYTHFYGPAIRAARRPTFEQMLLGPNTSPLLSAWYQDLRSREVDHPLERYRSRASFERNLTRLVQSIRSHGSRVLLVTQPSLYRPDLTERERLRLVLTRQFMWEAEGWLGRTVPTAGSLAAAMQAFNATTMRVAQRAGVPLVDAASRVERSLANFSDDCHPTEAGARQAAELVAAWMRTAPAPHGDFLPDCLRAD